VVKRLPDFGQEPAAWFNRGITISLILICLPLARLAAQTTGAAPTDSIVAPPDTLLQPATAAVDTSAQTGGSVFTDKIPHSADRISISVDGNRIYLRGNAKITYQNLTLTADNITIDQEKGMLYARGTADSVDAKGNMIFKGAPVLDEKGREPMYGERIEYDFKTKRGKIDVGRTEMPPGYYKGTDVYKIADSTLLVEQGFFTTCDLPNDPHYYFKSDKMRLKMRDKVVAKPIYFYIADIPLGVFPFGVFPSKGGRSSGIIIPSYGESRVAGRFLDGLGYYWAPNDYFDAALQTTYYDKIGLTWEGQMRYNVRYLLNGRISGQYYPRDPATGQRRERWRFNFNHSQEIDPTLRISGSGSFQSDQTLVRQTSPSFNDRLRQNITSNLNISKRFKGGTSLNVSASSNQNLQTNELSYTLPSVNFSTRQSTIYETITGQSVGARRSWYQNIYYNYSSRFTRQGSKTEVDPAPGDTTGTTTFDEEVRSGLQHNLSLNSPQSVFKYFSLNPSFNYTETWVDEVTTAELNEETNLIERRQKKQFAIRRTFNTSVSAKTTVYGLFEPNIGELKFIRHKMDPSVSWNYNPDFSDPAYGYFETVRDSAGNEVMIDRFGRSPFGGTPSRESQTLGIRLNNLFQAKLIDEEGDERKLDLFKANFSTSYNFKDKEKPWGGLSASYATTILGKQLNASARYSLYTVDEKGIETNTLFWDAGKFLPRLTSFNTSIGFNVDNTLFQTKEEDKEKAAADTTSAENEGIISTQRDIQPSLRDEIRETSNIDLPWSVSFNLNYILTKTNPLDPRESINLSTSADFKLTENWKVSWRANFDLVRKDLVYQSFNIYRDLHCWQMSFNWQPTVGYYSFQINIKDPSLKDIKLTKHPSASTFDRY